VRKGASIVPNRGDQVDAGNPDGQACAKHEAGGEDFASSSADSSPICPPSRLKRGRPATVLDDTNPDSSMNHRNQRKRSAPARLIDSYARNDPGVTEAGTRKSRSAHAPDGFMSRSTTMLRSQRERSVPSRLSDAFIEKPRRGRRVILELAPCSDETALAGSKAAPEKQLSDQQNLDADRGRRRISTRRRGKEDVIPADSSDATGMKEAPCSNETSQAKSEKVHGKWSSENVSLDSGKGRRHAAKRGGGSAPDASSSSCQSCTCFACGSGADLGSKHSASFACVRCRRVFHGACLQPPLNRIPDLCGWACPVCLTEGLDVDWREHPGKILTQEQYFMILWMKSRFRNGVFLSGGYPAEDQREQEELARFGGLDDQLGRTTTGNGGVQNYAESHSPIVKSHPRWEDNGSGENSGAQVAIMSTSCDDVNPQSDQQQSEAALETEPAAAHLPGGSDLREQEDLAHFGGLDDQLVRTTSGNGGVQNYAESHSPIVKSHPRWENNGSGENSGAQVAIMSTSCDDVNPQSDQQQSEAAPETEPAAAHLPGGSELLNSVKSHPRCDSPVMETPAQVSVTSTPCESMPPLSDLEQSEAVRSKQLGGLNSSARPENVRQDFAVHDITAPQVIDEKSTITHLLQEPQSSSSVAGMAVAATGSTTAPAGGISPSLSKEVGIEPKVQVSSLHPSKSRFFQPSKPSGLMRAQAPSRISSS
jgi:hypothetical protein